MSTWALSIFMIIFIQECVQAEDISKRFLLDTATTTTPTNFCTSNCPIRCVSGYVRSPYGCYYCQCSSGSATSSNVSASGVTVNGQQYLSHPCHTAFTFCGLKCYYGLLTGNNGCQYCACASPPRVQATPTIPATYAVPTIPTRRQLSELSTVISAAITIPPTTTIRTTTTTRRAPPTTLSWSTSPTNGGYIDPCIPSQQCNKNCSGDFILGPEDCQYCICGPHSSAGHGATITAATWPYTTVYVSGVGVAISTTMDPAVQSETCSIAKVICQLKCPDGFTITQDDCLHCKCSGHP